jgi:hypothetical protein
MILLLPWIMTLSQSRREPQLVVFVLTIITFVSQSIDTAGCVRSCERTADGNPTLAVTIAVPVFR